MVEKSLVPDYKTCKMNNSSKITCFVMLSIQAILWAVWIYLQKNNVIVYQQKPRTETISTIDTREAAQGNKKDTLERPEVVAENISKVVTTEKAHKYKSCPLIPPGLAGALKIEEVSQTWESMEKKYSLLKDGRYTPKSCVARQKVAILVPFRDRENHLKVFLNHMHPFLMRQQLEYGIYVVEQSKGLEFNRGYLFNVGFKEALKETDYDCFILHDVDLLPENDHNIYTCSVDQPKHLAFLVNKWNYKAIYPMYFGGVSAMTREQYETINGFSNSYFGWGAEDDDLYNRLIVHTRKPEVLKKMEALKMSIDIMKIRKTMQTVIKNNMSVYRAINDVLRYTSLQHKQAKPNPKRFNLLSSGKKRMSKDGLNTLKYNLLQKTYKKLFIHITVNITSRADLE